MLIVARCCKRCLGSSVPSACSPNSRGSSSDPLRATEFSRLTGENPELCGRPSDLLVAIVTLNCEDGRDFPWVTPLLPLASREC